MPKMSRFEKDARKYYKKYRDPSRNTSKHSPTPMIWAVLGLFVGLCSGFWILYFILS